MNLELLLLPNDSDDFSNDEIPAELDVSDDEVSQDELDALNKDEIEEEPSPTNSSNEDDDE